MDRCPCCGGDRGLWWKTFTSVWAQIGYNYGIDWAISECAAALNKNSKRG